jgi:Zn finger protein HypA/HybF involved in hydrogenase expression
MPDKQQISIQKNLVDRPGEVICTTCQAVMSRRWLKKPDTETGLTEAIYRCPKCGVATSHWIEID